MGAPPVRGVVRRKRVSCALSGRAISLEDLKKSRKLRLFAIFSGKFGLSRLPL